MEVAPRSAEDVPALYRSILLMVERLERHDRREAADIRARALAVYATSWDEAHRQRLIGLERRLHRSLQADARFRRRWLRLP